MYLTRFVEQPSALPSWSRLVQDTLGTRLDVDGFAPQLDLVETDKGYELSLALPGLKREDINLEVKSRVLTIKGERKFTREENKRYHVVESRYGSFSRSFRLPETVLEDGIEASLADGILHVFIPKDEQKQLQRVIEVK